MKTYLKKKKKSLRALSAEFTKFPVVVLLGRVNVGKSTLFNTLLEEKKAVVAAAPGTTRDINYGVCSWRGHHFVLVDTGGFTGERGATEIEQKTAEQALRIVSAADVMIFVVDSKQGLNPDDRLFLKGIRAHSDAPILLTANKSEQGGTRHAAGWSEWSKLGIGEPFRVSAMSGQGTGDLLDAIVEHFDGDTKKGSDSNLDSEIKVAIVGRPNVGKSSILNQIVGEDRVIVSPIAHTTREPQDTLLEYDGVRLRIIDTVGMRKKSKIASKIDSEGFARSMRTIEKADIVIVVLESTVTPSNQESRLASLAKEVGAGILIVINKWDLIEEKTTKTAKAFEDLFKHYFKTIYWAPALFVSALSGQRIPRILDAIMAVVRERNRLIDQGELDTFLKRTMANQMPQWARGRRKPVVYSLSQSGTNPPAFALTVNDPMAISFAYVKYIEHRLRDTFGFEGTPIKVYTKQREKVKHA